MTNQLNVAVEEYTTPNPITADEKTGIDELASLMKSNGIRHIPIVNGGRVVGVVSERDLRLASGLTRTEKRQIRADDIMAVDPVTVSGGASLDEVAFEMAERKIGSVIVNDQNDKLLGIFTVTDALNALIDIARGNESE